MPLAVEAQPPTKVHRVGWLLGVGSPLSGPDPSFEAFRQRLRELSHIEGQNLIFEDCYAEGRPERLPNLAAELVQLKVDVIVAEGATAIRAAQHATRTIPIVMAAPVIGLGKGSSPASRTRGGNITCIAVLANPASPAYASTMHNLTVAARALELQLHVVEVRRADELDTAFAAMTRAGADAVIVELEAIRKHDLAKK